MGQTVWLKVRTLLMVPHVPPVIQGKSALLLVNQWWAHNVRFVEWHNFYPIISLSKWQLQFVAQDTTRAVTLHISLIPQPPTSASSVSPPSKQSLILATSHNSVTSQASNLPAWFLPPDRLPCSDTCSLQPLSMSHTSKVKSPQMHHTFFFKLRVMNYNTLKKQSKSTDI